MTHTGREAPPPRVSVIVAARNVSNYIEETLASLFAQSLQEFEVIIVDDRSTDDTLAKLEAAAVADARIRVLAGPGRGPAAARNLALGQARGAWIAIIDGDDLIASWRLQRLLEAAESADADLAADNLTAFYDDGSPDHLWLVGEAWSRPRTIDIEDYLDTRGDAGSRNRLGYLKPLFRASTLRTGGFAYDESLFIGEDYDLVARCLLSGAQFHYIPDAGYRYRRHSASISHRIAPAQLAGIMVGLKRLQASAPAHLHAVFEERLRGLAADLLFVETVEAIKRGSVVALAQALVRPQLLARLVQAAREGVQRRWNSRSDGSGGAALADHQAR